MMMIINTIAQEIIASGKTIFSKEEVLAMTQRFFDANQQANELLQQYKEQK